MPEFKFSSSGYPIVVKLDQSIAYIFKSFIIAVLKYKDLHKNISKYLHQYLNLRVEGTQGSNRTRQVNYLGEV